jgi:DNA invertase Pin-like site-specific DNA recombinase
MNCVTYLRISTEDQSLEPQRLELKAWCERNGWTVVAEYSDVISGAKATRPGMDRMLGHCAAGGVDAIVIVRLDRLGRSVLNVASLIERLDAMNVALVCTAQGIDTRKDSPCGRLQLAMLSAVAAFERDLIRERTKAGLRAAVARGKKLGRRPMARDAEADAVTIEGWIAAEKPGGLRGLAAQLGVASPMTAGRMVARYMEAKE